MKRRRCAVPMLLSKLETPAHVTPTPAWLSRLLWLSRLSCLSLAWGCSSDQDVLVGRNYDRDDARGGAGTGVPAVDSSAPADGEGGHAVFDSSVAPRIDSGSTGDAAGFCAGGPIELPVVGGCTSDIAKRAFKFGLCSCTDLAVSGVLTTASFSSDNGKSLPAGGSIGVNGPYVATTSASTVGGSIWAQDGVSIRGQDIAGDLRTGGDLTGRGDVRVRGDVYLAGNVQGSDLSIDGRLHAPEGSSLAGLTAAGGIVRQSVTVVAPCDCSKSLDIGAIVAYYATNHDNASQGITSDDLMSLSGSTERVLGCGRYYLRAIDTGANDLTLRIIGRTVIAVGGNIQSRGALRIAVEPGAELDLFVNGNIDLQGLTDIGDRARPAATRIYGSAEFTYSGDANFAANLYIPSGRFVAATRMEIWGSVFAEGFALSGTLTAHYDEAVLDVAGCSPSGQECEGCGECTNPTPACIAGRCSACTADEQCCPPLRCDAGRCVADIPIK